MNSVVYNEDCMIGMKRFADNYFDLAIVDPPYGLDVANMNMGVGTGAKCSKIKNRLWKPKDWDKGAPTKEYFEELFRISKNQIIWGGNYFDLKPTQGFIIWDKMIDEQLTFSQVEYAWTSFQRAAKICKHSVYKKGEDKIHPTQKPIKLYRWILKNYASVGDKILDTHVGSGSSRIACSREGFEFTGFEIDTDYWKAQEKRFAEFLSQPTLF
jgi:site-specific DNA-methyltransferase (adenine-specific)